MCYKDTNCKEYNCNLFLKNVHREKGREKGREGEIVCASAYGSQTKENHPKQ